MARAFNEAYNSIPKDFPAEASRITSIQVDQLTDRVLNAIRDSQLETLDRQAGAVIPFERESRDRLRAAVREALIDPLTHLRMLQQLAFEAGLRFHHDHSSSTALHEALMRLQARSIRTADEIIHLLEGGYGGAALARWRTLHEIDVTAKLLADRGEATAQRYLDAQWVEMDKSATLYARHQAALRFDALSEEDVAENKRLRELAVQQHGADIGLHRGFGWAKADVADANLAGIEKVVGLERLRPFYNLASHAVHASSRNTVVDRSADDSRRLRVGPDTDGLIDPIQLTAYALASVTRSLVYSAVEDDLTWTLYVEALDRQAARTVESLPEEDVLDGDPGVAVPLVRPDDTSLLRLPVEILKEATIKARRQLTAEGKLPSGRARRPSPRPF